MKELRKHLLKIHLHAHHVGFEYCWFFDACHKCTFPQVFNAIDSIYKDVAAFDLELGYFLFC